MAPPRVASSSLSSNCTRSRPSSSTRPAAMRPLALGTSRMMESAVMLLPHPDSPTSASVSWRSTVKLTLRMAACQRPSIRNSVVRLSTTSAGALFMPKPRVGRVAQPIAEHVQSQHDNEDREARKNRKPGRIENVLEALADHSAPGGGRWPDTEADEGKRRLGADRGR